LNPKYIRGHLWLGQTYEFLGNKAGAKTEYNTVLKLDPKSKEARDAREGLKRLTRPATPTQPNYQDYWDKYWDDLYKK
jgi:predicted TPR repeat methyltransferase